MDNEGYVKDHKIDFISLNGNIFTNKRGQDETFIPQHNNVNLGDNLNKHLRVNGYRYKNNKNDKVEGFINENKLNINGIAKLSQTETNIKLLVNNIIDNQKNTNLNKMLNNLNDYLSNKLKVVKPNSDKERRKVFNYDSKDPDVWVNNILKLSIVDIFIEAYDKHKKLNTLYNLIKNDNMDINDNNLTNFSNENYVQLLVANKYLDSKDNIFINDEEIYNGNNIKEF